MSVLLAVHVEDAGGRRWPAGSVRFELSEDWVIVTADAVRWRNDGDEPVVLVGVGGGRFFWAFEPHEIAPRGDVVIRDLLVRVDGNRDCVESSRGMFLRDEISLEQFEAALDEAISLAEWIERQ